MISVIYISQILCHGSPTADLSGVADDNEQAGFQLQAAPITGTYSISTNGYGSMTINSGDLADVSTLGLYLTDPNLNLTDPNNTTSGLGGALLSDMDAVLAVGTGLAIPQTDSSKASFSGQYAFNAQALWFLFEFAAQGSVRSGILNGTGLASDPFDYLGRKSNRLGRDLRWGNASRRQQSRKVHVALH